MARTISHVKTRMMKDATHYFVALNGNKQYYKIGEKIEEWNEKLERWTPSVWWDDREGLLDICKPMENDIPEGATHEFEGMYYKKQDGVWFFWGKLSKAWICIAPSSTQGFKPLQDKLSFNKVVEYKGKEYILDKKAYFEEIEPSNKVIKVVYYAEVK